jgi:hypothetical protein
LWELKTNFPTTTELPNQWKTSLTQWWSTVALKWATLWSDENEIVKQIHEMSLFLNNSNSMPTFSDRISKGGFVICDEENTPRVIIATHDGFEMIRILKHDFATSNLYFDSLKETDLIVGILKKEIVSENLSSLPNESLTIEILKTPKRIDDGNSTSELFGVLLFPSHSKCEFEGLEWWQSLFRNKTQLKNRKITQQKCHCCLPNVKQQIPPNVFFFESVSPTHLVPFISNHSIAVRFWRENGKSESDNVNEIEIEDGGNVIYIEKDGEFEKEKEKEKEKENEIGKEKEKEIFSKMKSLLFVVKSEMYFYDANEEGIDSLMSDLEAI